MKAFFALLALSLLVGCSGSIDPLEPPAKLVVIDMPTLEPYHLWSHQLGQGSGRQHLKLAPLVDGERLFAATYSGRVEALDNRAGTKLWRTELDAQINAGPGDGDNLLLLGGDAEVLALAKSDGSLHWRTAVSSEVLGIPQRLGNVVVAHSVDGNITAIDAASGERLWQHRESVPTLSLRGTADPVLLDGVALVGTAGGKVVALSLADGSVLWEMLVAEPRGRTELERVVDVDAELAVADGVVYASSFQGNLVAIALSSGQMLWSRDIATVAAIALDRQYLYVSDINGSVWQLSRRDGGTMWRQTALSHRNLSAPVLQGNYLLLGDYEGYLHWLSKDEGNLVARTRVRSFEEHWPVDDAEIPAIAFFAEDRTVLQPPATVGERVFALDKRGVLDAYRLIPVSREAESQ